MRLRIAGANITSGNNQTYLDPGTHIFQGLKPDVVCIQEFKVGSSTAAEILAWVHSTFGAEYTYFRESGAAFPMASSAATPILASGEWEDANVSDRDFAWARIDVPGPNDLYAISVHLLTTSATNRNNQATSLVQYINNASIPAGAFLVIAGDYNTDNRSEACYSTFSAKVVHIQPVSRRPGRQPKHKRLASQAL